MSCLQSISNWENLLEVLRLMVGSIVLVLVVVLNLIFKLRRPINLKLLELLVQYSTRETVHLELPINKTGEDQNKCQPNCLIASCSIGIHCFLSVGLHPSSVSFNSMQWVLEACQW